MIGWYQITSWSITNGIRIFTCLFMVAMLLKLERPSKSTVWLSLIGGAITTLLYVSSLPQLTAMVFEVLAVLFILNRKYHCEIRICAFLTICFEIAAALWDSLVSVGLELSLQNSTLAGVNSNYMVSVWMVRILMVGLIAVTAMQGDKAEKMLMRFSSVIAVAGMFCVLVLTEQSALSLPEGQLTTWSIFSIILLVSVLFYRVNRQYEMGKEIVQLETEKNALLERDYQTLSNTYAVNAKLFHDFHNHIDVLHRYLSKGHTAEALDYLDSLRSPIQVLAQTVWVGDEAVDYLINSKIAIANSRHIRMKTNIEFPRHTNIDSVDLVVILGNLLDNALDAAASTEGSLRFVNLTIRRINDMLVLKVENGCSVAPASVDGNLQTAKADKNLHGWGLKSARTAAGRYDGIIETEYDNYIFRAVVTLSFRSVC